MRPNNIMKLLVDSGFTQQQAVGLTTVVFAIRSGIVSVDDAEHMLEQNGFEEPTAEKLSKVFFEILAAA
jgi:hypothetical protein